jgi:hypothetical protein
MMEITGFTNASGPLTKRIWLEPDGALKSDGSACIMTRGHAQRVRVADVGALAGVIEHVRPDQALALGALRHDLPDRVEIVTKKQLATNGSAIARTSLNISYRKDEPAVALADHDRKGMPQHIAEELHNRGGLWPTLITIVPDLASAAHVTRWSTSSGLFRIDTGEQLAGSGGLHEYIFVKDGSDTERFLKTLHRRCWLAGFGWFIVGAGGQLLERSIVDRMVYAPERLVFEGAPILAPPVRQDKECRRPVPTDGELIDTRRACPDLGLADQSRFKELKAKAEFPLRGAAAKARREYEEDRAQDLARRAGISLSDARVEIAKLCDGVLLPNLVLPFDDPDLGGCTVADVLADPARFEGATLADPLEGIDYGRCVARVMRRDDGGELWIHSFAHGRTVYKLRHSEASVRAAIDMVAKKDATRVLLEMLPIADLAIDEQGRLRKYAAERAGIGLREINRMLKAAAAQARAEQKQQERDRRVRERTDPRPQIPRCDDSGEWLPAMAALNDVIAPSPAPHPSVRDIDCDSIRSLKIAMPKTHFFTSANEGDPQ